MFTLIIWVLHYNYSYISNMKSVVITKYLFLYLLYLFFHLDVYGSLSCLHGYVLLPHQSQTRTINGLKALQRAEMHLQYRSFSDTFIRDFVLIS